MTSQQHQWYLQSMGIQMWKEREKNNTNDKNQTIEVFSDTPIATEIQDKPTQQLDWQTLREQVKNCQRCELYKTRRNPVFGVGNPNADLLIIGEAPGAEEDRKGEPFVGRAGKLLDEMLKTIGLKRADIYIANILKSRPPGNRDPKVGEVAACTPYLTQQIELIQPKLVLALGRIAAHFLLETTLSLARLRQKQYTYGGQKTPLIVTYHPAYLLRNPIEKHKTYEDLLWAQELLLANSQ